MLWIYTAHKKNETEIHISPTYYINIYAKQIKIKIRKIVDAVNFNSQEFIQHIPPAPEIIINIKIA